MSAKDFEHLRYNAFFAFIFNGTEQDGQRRSTLKQLLSIFKTTPHHSHGLCVDEVLATFAKKFRPKTLKLSKLCELFSVETDDELEVFRQCVGMFRVDDEAKIYFDDANGYDPITGQSLHYDMFATERRLLEERGRAIGRLGDRIVRILGETAGRRMDAADLLAWLDPAGMDDVSDPTVLLGHIVMHFAEGNGATLVVEPDSGCRSGLSVRLPTTPDDDDDEEGGPLVWPSAHNRKVEARLLAAEPAYPTIVTAGGRYDVRLAHCRLPADGFFMALRALDGERDYVSRELSALYALRSTALRRLSPLQGRCCLLEDGGCLFRARLTGQTGDGRAAVECVDEPRIVFAPADRLYAVPGRLLGVPSTGLYGVLASADDDCVFLMSAGPELIRQWHYRVADAECCGRVHIVSTTSADSEYAGLRKSRVHKVQLKLGTSIDGRPAVLLPDVWLPAGAGARRE